MNQKDNIQTCNQEGCDNEGLYKAPLSKYDLNKLQWFCLPHIKEFNKSWNFHKEMGSDEIEKELRRDSTWRRPTKPFGSSGKYYNFQVNEDIDPATSKVSKKASKLIWSLDILNLTIKSQMEEIKKNYKKLAKKYHPDAKSDIKNSDEKFRNVVEAYNYLIEFNKNK